LKNTKHFFIIAITLIVLVSCSSSNQKDIESVALKLANTIDTNSILLLKKYSFVKRGVLEFWQRNSYDTTLYSISGRTFNDTTELMIYQPYIFSKDFTVNYKFDTSVFYSFTFYEVRGRIVRTISDSLNGANKITDTSILVKVVFPEQNPFAKLKELSSLKEKFTLVGTSYREDIGDFIVFWLSPQYKLTYMPDTLKLNEWSKRNWIEDFKRGKEIKKHWSLLKQYE
jgi:hypothetical protein